MKRFYQLSLMSLLALVSSGLHAEINATLDRTKGSVGSPLLLTLDLEQSSDHSPDLTVLERDFALLGSRKSSRTYFKNGRRVISQRWLITLSPRHSGDLTLPSIPAGGEASQPLSFTALPVDAAAASPTLALETSLSDTLIYNHSTTTLSVRLYYRNGLQHAEITEPELDNVLVYPLGAQRFFKEQRQATTYNVIEQRYSLLPQQPGRYHIPPLQFSGRTVDGEPLSAVSNGLDFEAIHWPQQAQGAQLAATELRIEAEWQPLPQPIRAGDTLTRTLVIEGHNVPAAWLPVLNWPQLEGARFYPEPPQREEQVDNGVLVSRLTQNIQLLVTGAGQLQIPAQEVLWWDTVRESLETTRLAGQRLQAEPFLPTPAPATTVQNQAAPSPTKSTTAATSTPGWIGWVWALVALVCGAGWTLTRSRLKQVEQQLQATESNLCTLQQQQAQLMRQRDEEQITFQQLEQSCLANLPARAHHDMIQWAGYFWPDLTITSLDDIDRAAAFPTLSYLLRNLTHSLHSRDDEPWHGDLMLEQLKRLRRRGPQPKKPRLEVEVSD